MSRRKILFITPWYPTQDNPVWGVFVQEHAKAVRLYDDVRVLHGVGVDPNLRWLWRVERVLDLTEGIPTYRVWHRRPPIPQARYLLYVWSIFQAFRYIVAQGFYPDVLHAHVYFVGFAAVLLGKLYCLPVVITEHLRAFSGAFQLGGELVTWLINLRLQLRQVALRRLDLNRRRSVLCFCCSEFIRGKTCPQTEMHPNAKSDPGD